MWYIKDRDWTICWSCIRFFMTIKETKLAWKLLFYGKSLNDFSSQKRRWKNALWSGDMRTKRLHKLTRGGCRNEYQWPVGRTLVKYFHGLNAWPFLHLAKVPRLTSHSLSRPEPTACVRQFWSLLRVHITPFSTLPLHHSCLLWFEESFLNVL